MSTKSRSIASATCWRLPPNATLAPARASSARLDPSPPSSNSHMHPAQRILPRAAEWSLASFLIIAGPLLIASLLLAVLCGGALWDCAPVWHDEMWYFNEMAVFDAAGWEGGYTVSHEWPARAE